MERRRIESMANPMMSVDDVAKILAYSKSHAYKVIGRLNEELEEKGFLTRPGMVPRKYFFERTGLEMPQEGETSQ
jgi:predicted transcriptional regulator